MNQYTVRFKLGAACVDELVEADSFTFNALGVIFFKHVQLEEGAVVDPKQVPVDPVRFYHGDSIISFGRVRE